MFDLRFSNFSKREDHLYLKIRSRKDKIFAPFCVFFEKYHISPDHLSYLGLSMAFLFVLFLRMNPWIALAAMILNVFFDGLDGTYARFLNKIDVKGDLLDRACDYGSFLVIFLALIYYSVLSPFWGAIYLVNYVTMFFLTITLNNLKIDFPFFPKTKYFIHLFFSIWVISGLNIFDPILVFFSIYTFFGNLFLFYRLQCSLS